VDQPDRIHRAEALVEAAAVLAGTMLMAAGISGNSPSAHDSTMSLARRMPSIARYREQFYEDLLRRIAGTHGERLHAEAASTRQPFGRARQRLNEALARHRAAQLQQRHLALIYAAMGYPDASRRAARAIPAASVRFLSEIFSRLASAHLLNERKALRQAAALLPEIQDLLHRGIACGALADPWNILGFQAMFPLASAQEDSVRDTRVDDLTHILQHILDLYARILSDAAAAGQPALVAESLPSMKRLATWWDRFASVEVNEVRRIHGSEAVQSAVQVARALDGWQQRGRSGDLAYWKHHLEGFRSPKAFALVVDTLLRHHEYRAALGLLMSWLAQAEQVPLDDGVYFFHALALRWMLEMTSAPADEGTGSSRFSVAERTALVKKFIDYLEANADDLWHVPALETSDSLRAGTSDEEDDLYGAAYEGVIYRDSADDDQEGSVADGGYARDFNLQHEAERLGVRLRFLSTVARLWQIATRWLTEHGGQDGADENNEAVQAWLNAAQQNRHDLLSLADAVHAHAIPAPLGSHDSLLEYDRRRVSKDHVLDMVIAATLDTSLAVGALRGALGGDVPTAKTRGPHWESLAIRIERAFGRGAATEIQEVLPGFLNLFQEEPIVFQALNDGGDPRHILRARIAQSILRALATQLPRLGLMRETFVLLQTARIMEKASNSDGRRITEFSSLFQVGFEAVIDNILEAARAWTTTAGAAADLVRLLETLTSHFLKLWVEHSQTLQFSVLEILAGDPEWTKLQEFIRHYGGDLFHAQFMTLANLRGILHRGVDPYFSALKDNPDPLHPVKLTDDLDSALPRTDAVRYLQLALQAVVENYEEYRDYNSSTPLSDYGENLHVLLDFLRLKASYERFAWHLRPLVQVHAILARRGFAGAAALWHEAFVQTAAQASRQHLEELARREQQHGVRLHTVRDRLEEAFVRPLALDRLCAAIAPAVQEAAEAGNGDAFVRLEHEIQQQASQPAGVGLDVPPWLQRLEQELHRVQVASTALAEIAESWGQGPKRLLSLSELQRQLDEWQKATDH
jgi:hypothetical protein